MMLRLLEKKSKEELTELKERAEKPYKISRIHDFNNSLKSANKDPIVYLSNKIFRYGAYI